MPNANDSQVILRAANDMSNVRSDAFTGGLNARGEYVFTRNFPDADQAQKFKDFLAMLCVDGGSKIRVHARDETQLIAYDDTIQSPKFKITVPANSINQKLLGKLRNAQAFIDDFGKIDPDRRMSYGYHSMQNESPRLYVVIEGAGDRGWSQQVQADLVGGKVVNGNVEGDGNAASMARRVLSASQYQVLVDTADESIGPKGLVRHYYQRAMSSLQESKSSQTTMMEENQQARRRADGETIVQQYTEILQRMGVGKMERTADFPLLEFKVKLSLKQMTELSQKFQKLTQEADGQGITIKLTFSQHASHLKTPRRGIGDNEKREVALLCTATKVGDTMINVQPDELAPYLATALEKVQRDGAYRLSTLAV